MSEFDESLPTELELALAYTPSTSRNRLHTVFALDQRLGRISAATTEPILGQMRLAWWRDMLAAPVLDRPKGDAVLDALGECWEGDEAALTKLVDGWEVLVASGSLGEGELKAVVVGRSAPVSALFGRGDPEAQARVESAAASYVFADLACRLSDGNERNLAISLGNDLSTPRGRLPKLARGIGVLEALAMRALARGGKPLMDGRGASLVALKAGILGR